jgi:hypothetical protein
LKLVRDIEARIAEACEPYAFVRESKWAWVRRWGWKTDRIRMAIHGLSLIINCEVFIPPNPDSIFDHSCVGIEDLAQITGGIGNRWSLAGASFRKRKIITSVESAIPKAFEWFERYDTPVGCLAHLLTPHVNPQSREFKYQEEYLRKLQETVVSPCCLTTSPYTFPNDYSRSLFDPKWEGPIPRPPA